MRASRLSDGCGGSSEALGRGSGGVTASKTYPGERVVHDQIACDIHICLLLPRSGLGPQPDGFAALWQQYARLAAQHELAALQRRTRCGVKRCRANPRTLTPYFHTVTQPSL